MECLWSVFQTLHYLNHLVFSILLSKSGVLSVFGKIFYIGPQGEAMFFVLKVHYFSSKNAGKAATSSSFSKRAA